MRNKHTGKIIALLAIMFASSFGQSIEQVFALNVDYDAATIYCILLTLLNMILVSALMMAIPFFARIAKKAKLPYKSGHRLCLWNSISLFILSSVLLVVTESSFIGGIGSVIYYFINRWLFVSERQSTPEVQPICKTPSEQKSRTAFNNVTPLKIKYCSKCGQSIDPITKKCSGCNKQYFKGFSVKTVILVVVTTLFIISYVCSIIMCYQYTEMRKTNDTLKSDILALKCKVTTLHEENQELKSQLDDSSSKIQLDVIVVVHDSSNTYHILNCEQLTNDIAFHLSCLGSGESFWACTLGFAKENGYKPCSHCCNNS